MFSLSLCTNMYSENEIPNTLLVENYRLQHIAIILLHNLCLTETHTCEGIESDSRAQLFLKYIILVVR